MISERNGHTLEFDEEKHKYALDGKGIIGVTSFIKASMPISQALLSWQVGKASEYTAHEVMGMFEEGIIPDKDDLLEIIKNSKTAHKEELDKAADIGTLTHNFAFYTETEQDLKLLEVKEKIKEHKDREKIENCIKGFWEWKKENQDEILASESVVASIKYKYGGKFDTLRRRKDSIILSDFKTSIGIYLEHFVQLSAYSIAIKEWLGKEVEGFEILRFGKDGKFESKLITKKSELRAYENQAIRCKQTYDLLKKKENDFGWKRKK